MRFKNGHEMLKAKLSGAQTQQEDSLRILKEEYDRKRQELLDAHLAEVARLNTQIGDILNVVETYEAAISKAAEFDAANAQMEKQ